MLLTLRQYPGQRVVNVLKSSHCLLAKYSDELLGFIVAYSTGEIRTVEYNLTH
jgi:hypothetical protein